ncbi:MAG: RluA family pseudouridine synthase [Burkholderiaceae bacterium]
MPDLELACVHVDASLLVIDKPSGLLAVPGRGAALADCVAARARALYPDALVVHRLDMATSGLMLLARGAAVQRALSIQFAQRTVGKTYIALVAGRPAQDEGEIDLPLVADWPERPKQMVDAVHGKPSLTRYRVLDHDPARNVARLELTPVSGRSHQLRVHLLAIGHPILGDALYSPTDVQALAPRLQLHAARLRFAHPVTGAALVFESEVPF